VRADCVASVPAADRLLDASIPEIEVAVAGLTPLRQMRYRLYLLEEVDQRTAGMPPAAVRAFERVLRELQPSDDRDQDER
jgi:hypothetical protein